MKKKLDKPNSKKGKKQSSTKAPTMPQPLSGDIAQDKESENSNEAQSVELTPWPDPVDGRVLLDMLRTISTLYIIVPEYADVVLAIWPVHTYCFDEFQYTPRLFLKSPTRRCGKTRALTLLSKLVHRPSLTADATAASLFPEIHARHPTVLLDEYDSMAFAKDLRNGFNSGYAHNGEVRRKYGTFSTFTPIAIASITPIHPTMEDRCIKVLLKRKKLEEQVENPHDFDGLDIRRKCLRWAQDHRIELKKARPGMPEGLDDRAVELWTPLIAIADEVGGKWPALTRKAALALSTTREDIGMEEQLLRDIKEIFQADDWLSSDVLVQRLAAKEDSRWGAEGLNPWKLANILDGFSIRPKLTRKGKLVLRGYSRLMFEDAWSRWT
jgi:hypothetical protein